MARHKKNKKALNVRVNEPTPQKLKELAMSLGFSYGGEGHTGAFLDAIANGEFILVQANLK
jgi:hypothetical protein